ncbi:MAG: helix-turn-helix transcriptional regulator [Sulfitobacter sp.]
MSHPVDIHVGQRLKALRKLRQLSQTDLGKELGLSFQQVQKYESGSNRISASRLFEVGQFLNVAPEYFFEGINSKNEAPETTPADDAIAMALSYIGDQETRDKILSFIESLPESKSRASV